MQNHVPLMRCSPTPPKILEENVEFLRDEKNQTAKTDARVSPTFGFIRTSLARLRNRHPHTLSSYSKSVIAAALLLPTYREATVSTVLLYWVISLPVTLYCFLVCSVTLTHCLFPVCFTVRVVGCCCFITLVLSKAFSSKSSFHFSYAHSLLSLNFPCEIFYFSCPISPT